MRRRPTLTLASLAAAAATAAAALVAVPLAPADAGGAAPASARVVRPEKDPFYRYDGDRPLREIAPGTPLKTRDVTLGVDVNDTPLPAQQILYRTTDTLGHPVVSVTTVVAPTAPASTAAAPRLVAYLSFYDALSAKCNPSYTLRGGDPGAANQQLTDVEQATVASLAGQGYVVTVPDFENQDLHWVAGPESGTSTLDSITATEAALGLDAGTPVGTMGYSGGSIAANWAAELQPAHAPQLNMVGTAMGGVPADLRHNLPYVNGTPEWSDVIPGAMIGVARAYGLDLDHYLSRWGRKVAATESTQCIGEMSGEFPNLTIKHLMKPRYRDVLGTPAFRRIFQALRMGRQPGHPSAPMFMLWANHDGTGDDVMVAADQAALAATYCAEGVPVATVEVPNADHTQGGSAFIPQAEAWLASRFDGVPAPSTC